MAPEMTEGDAGLLRRLLPWLWLALSLGWAVVIVVTDQIGWPLALWIATTVGPLTLLQSRTTRMTGSVDTSREGDRR